MADNSITYLASEFFVLSTLIRLGADATLTLGNKKKVDIVVNKAGTALTIDVKGLQSSGDFILGNHEDTFQDVNHYFIFVYYSDFKSIELQPEIFVVSASETKNLIKNRSGVNNVSLKTLRGNYKKDLSEALQIFLPINN